MAGKRIERRVERPPVARGNEGVTGASPATKTRRVLGDIGNLVGTRVVRRQVSKDGGLRPVKGVAVTTWGTKQQRTILTGSTDTVMAEAEVNTEDVLQENVATDRKSSTEGSLAAPALPAPTRHPPLKPLIKRISRCTAVKKVPTLTAVLSARSEAIVKQDTQLMQVESDHVHNIDERDADNELCVVDYVEDIYNFYRRIEVQSCVAPDYMSRQNEINHKMRAILIDWLIEVHLKFGLMPETLFLATNLLDRYLSVASVSKKTLQLVGVTALLLAAKYEEIIAPQIETMVFITEEAYTQQQVLAMEKAMLNKLRFNLTVPTPYVFIVRFLKAASADRQTELLTYFFVELCLTEYVAVKYTSSLLAAAAVYSSLHTLQKEPFWTPLLTHHSGYCELQLRDCTRFMVGLHRKAAEAKLLVVHGKYSCSKFRSVATLAPANLNF